MTKQGKLAQRGAGALNPADTPFPTLPSRSRTKCGNSGEPERRSCTSATPSASSSYVMKSLSFVVPCPWRALADHAPARGINVERALGPRAMQSRRLVEHRHHEVAPFLEFRLVLRDESCGPFSASTAAAWRIEHGFEVDCHCSLVIAPISSFGPPRNRCASRSWHTPSTRRSGSACGARVSARPARWSRIRNRHRALLVHVVGQHPDLRVLQQHVGQRAQFGAV